MSLIKAKANDDLAYGLDALGCENVEYCRCIANIWKGGEGGRCTRKNVFNDDSQIEEYEYCSQHREKYNECCEGGELKDGKAYGLYFGNIYDGKTWEDMVCWEKSLRRAKGERMRHRGMVIAANHRQKMGI